MKEVNINGQRVPFSKMDESISLSEGVTPSFLGYSQEYWIDGVRKWSKYPIKFYK